MGIWPMGIKLARPKTRGEGYERMKKLWGIRDRNHAKRSNMLALITGYGDKGISGPKWIRRQGEEGIRRRRDKGMRG